MAKKPTTDVNSVEIIARLDPYLDPESKAVYIKNSIKDAEGKDVGTEDILLDSIEGREILAATLCQILKRQPSHTDIDYAATALKGWARGRTPRAPINPVPSSPLAPGKSGAVAPAVKPALPTDKMAFFLGFKNVLMVRFLDPQDGRELPFAHPSVKAALTAILAEKLGRWPGNRERDEYFQRCAAEPFRDPHQNGGVKEDRLSQNSLVLATLGLMVARHKAQEGSFVGNQTALRAALEEICESNGLDSSDWLGGKHFTDQLWRNKTVLIENNLSLAYTCTFLKKPNARRPDE